MTQREKCEMLKDTIYQLYSKEGHTKSYISRLLNIERSFLSKMILDEWKLPEAKCKKTLVPSTEKFINKNRTLIKSRLDNDVTIVDIAKELKVGREKIYTAIKYDKFLKEAYENHAKRKDKAHIDWINKQKEKSSRDYDFQEIKGEEWLPILGYEKYYISNMGRVKKESTKYKSYYLLDLYENPLSHRYYVSLSKDSKSKTYQVARLVGLAFLGETHTKEKNTINHKNGNYQDNRVENLEWTTQAENNLHAYRELKRPVVREKRYIFDKILYKDKYEFNTVAAFARFLGKSETQTRRYMEEPEKYNIKFICYNGNCND